MSTIRRTNFLNVLSYIAIICVGLALMISFILGKVHASSPVIGALNLIAECLAYLVVACYSFSFARVKGVWWIVAWAAAVALIIVFKVLGLL